MLFILSTCMATLLPYSIQHELPTTLGRWKFSLLDYFNIYKSKERKRSFFIKVLFHEYTWIVNAKVLNLQN